ncbi:putative methyltransferase tdiE [Colletotrichum viniferum]|nr:putative methyltransferase tdiE [Colletotrichum viniferum]
MAMEDPILESTHSVDTVLPLGANLALEPDEEVSDADMQSNLGSDVDSALGEAIRSMAFFNRFITVEHSPGHGGERPDLPWEELDRQAFQYQLCQLTFENRLNFAPVYHPHRVLDVGCGIGMWAIDFGEEHPESEVIGVDLSPVQPGFTPPNVHYEIDDLEEEWSFSRKFDYIHSMMMTGAFRDWPNFHRQAFENLNPGGWLEIQDIDFPMRCDDGTIPPECDLGRWNDLMMEAGRRSGFLLDTCGRAAEMMANAGFIDIVRIPFKWPINQWPRDVRHKTLGLWTEANFSVGLESMTLALFTRFMGWRKEEVWDFSARASAEWRDVRRHGYFDVC